MILCFVDISWTAFSLTLRQKAGIGTANFTGEFTRNAVAETTEWGTRLRKFPEQLGVSLHSLYARKCKFASAATGETEKGIDIRCLEQELARVSEKRDI